MRKAFAIAVGVVAILVVVMLMRPARKTGHSMPQDPAAENTNHSHSLETSSTSSSTDSSSTPMIGDGSLTTSVTIGGTMPATLIDPEILISKSQRTLTVMSEGERVKTYRIVLGRVPLGDKEREGDGRTPEGDFYVCSRNPDSRYHRALGLSYPSDEDADRGRLSRLISKREYSDIVRAIRSMKRPPWNTALGGEIMIHGGGTARDWTDGCIALSDSDAEELFAAAPLGTPVRIDP